MLKTNYGSLTNPVIIFPEVEITSGNSLQYYYGIGGSGSVLIQGNNTDLPGIGIHGNPFSYVRSGGNFMLLLTAGGQI